MLTRKHRGIILYLEYKAIGGLHMKKSWDYVVVGGGPAGMFFAYECIQRNKNASVLIIERGKAVAKRRCPAQEKGKCIKCKICNIANGSSGAGAFSDGKMSLFNEDDQDFYVGGNLHKYIGVEETKNVIKYTDDVYLSFGATTEVKGKDNPEYTKKLKKISKEAGLNLVSIPIRHLGTDWAHLVYQKIERYLKAHKIKTLFETEVTDLIVSNGNVQGAKYRYPGAEATTEVYGKKVVLAVGRAGSEWLEEMCKKYSIASSPTAIDIGVRYELPDYVIKEVNDNLYEGKFIGFPEPYGDKVRTFCQNPSGWVSAESYKGDLTTANGHACKEKKSQNTNLALLASLELKGVKDPIESSRMMAKAVNQQGNGQILVQRLGDLLEGQPSTENGIKSNSVEPTLSATVPGDIGSCMPYRVVKDLIEFIKMLDKVIPGFAGEDNLLYAPEIKFYSNKLMLNDSFETSIKNLYAIGDGCGLTRGLMMASASGVQLAREIVN